MSAPERAVFGGQALPYLLLAPQFVVLGWFFFWPAGQAVWQAFHLQHPFSGDVVFVGLENFARLARSAEYHQSILVTLIFSGAATLLSVSAGLVLALAADRIVRGAHVLRTAVIWPYAVAPVVAGVLWVFLFHPIFGVAAGALRALGLAWNPLLNGTDAMLLIVAAAAWKQVSYNFVFFLAGLQAIPRSLIEAAAIDGARPLRRIRRIVLPLLAPTTVYVIVVNVVYAFFDTFGIVHAVTHGGPGTATATLVFKAWKDGFVGQDLGASAAQSLVLMVVVGALTIVQFRSIERRAGYA